MDYLIDADGLERAVGSRPLPALLKSIDHLDRHCETLLARSAVAVVGYTDRRGGRRAAVIGGGPGFSAGESDQRLGLPVPADAAPDASVSTLFLLPGWRETLRINGRLDPRRPETLLVDEAFLHCGKASSDRASGTNRHRGPSRSGTPASRRSTLRSEASSRAHRSWSSPPRTASATPTPVPRATRPASSK